MKSFCETWMNFKKLSICWLEADKRSIGVREDRALRKITQSDALQWAVGGKDFAGCKDFELKTPRSDETDTPTLDLGVELVIEHKGRLVAQKKALASPDYFPGKLPWQERRKILVEQRADFSVVRVRAAALAPRNFAGRRRRTWRIGGWWPSPSRFRMKPIRSGILRRFCLHG